MIQKCSNPSLSPLIYRTRAKFPSSDVYYPSTTQRSLPLFCCAPHFTLKLCRNRIASQPRADLKPTFIIQHSSNVTFKILGGENNLEIPPHTHPQLYPRPLIQPLCTPKHTHRTLRMRAHACTNACTHTPIHLHA